MLRIFVSYGHDQHAELAQRLKADLEERGHEVWFDRDRLAPGADWEQYIEDGLNWCAAAQEDARVVLLMTPHSVRRPDPTAGQQDYGYCLNELAWVLSRNIFLIPVMVVEVEPPLSICRVQWLDMRDCLPIAARIEQYERRVERLVEALEQRRLDAEAGQAKLLGALQPLDFRAEIAQHVPGFVERKWVLAKLDSWLRDQQGSRLFWITGGPGVGKTAIAAYLCHQRCEVLAFHFCRYGHDDKSDPRRCVTSLAYQLASQLPDYMERIKALDLQGEATKSAGTAFNNLIVEQLAPPFPAPGRPAIIVIDGLDEATKEGRNELAEFIADQWEMTPPWLRLVITSRPEPPVKQPLQRFSPLVLDTSLPENEADLRVYLRRELSALAGGREPDNAVVDDLVAKSEGTFLYVERVISDLREGHLEQSDLEQLPPGLGGLFQGLFRRQFPDVVVYQREHRPLLEMIVAARGPLPLELARAALHWDDHDYTVNARGQASGPVIDALGSLFPHTDRLIRPFHTAVVEWLTDGSRAGDYWVSAHKGHQRLADACWDQFRLNRPSMSQYARAHLPTHLMELGRWAELLLLVASPEPGLVEHWVERGEEMGARCLAGLIEHGDLQPDHRATLATQLARIHGHRGEYEEAERWLRGAVTDTSWWHGRRTRAVAIHELGSLYLYRREMKQADEAYRRALRLCLCGLPVHRDEAAANRIALATIACQEYRWSDAVRLARRAFREAESSADFRHAVAAQRLIGYALDYLGRYEEAETTLRAALERSRREGADVETVRLLVLIGCFHYGQATLRPGPYAEAIACLQRALAEAERSHSFYPLLDAKLRLGWCALAEGRTDDAVTWFGAITPALPAEAHRELSVGARLGLAAGAHQRGSLEEAGQQYETVVGLAEQNDFVGYEASALVGLGTVQWHLGRRPGAEATWRDARRLAKLHSPRTQQFTEVNLRACVSAPNVPPR